MLEIFLLAGLIRYLIATQSALQCAVIYSVLLAIAGFFVAMALEDVLINAGVNFMAAFVYFWLLDRFDDRALLWWPIMLLGFPLFLLI